MNFKWLAIKQLDQQIKAWQKVDAQYGRPRFGWVKTIRTTLNMSATQLGSLLGVGRARISQLEKAEINDAVTLRTLKEVAEAMSCKFVYAIVPKERSSLEEIIKARAGDIASKRIKRVAHTMALEAQAINPAYQQLTIKETTRNLYETLDSSLWGEHFSSKKIFPQKGSSKIFTTKIPQYSIKENIEKYLFHLSSQGHSRETNFSINYFSENSDVNSHKYDPHLLVFLSEDTKKHYKRTPKGK